MTAISPTLIAARYPLCVPDDTLMNDDQLIRYIRQRCGDEVADAITELIYSNSIREQLKAALEAIGKAYDAANDAAESMQDVHAEIERLVKEP